MKNAVTLTLNSQLVWLFGEGGEFRGIQGNSPNQNFSY